MCEFLPGHSGVDGFHDLSLQSIHAVVYRLHESVEEPVIREKILLVLSAVWALANVPLDVPRLSRR
jgi:hypothetical protein